MSHCSNTIAKVVWDKESREIRIVKRKESGGDLGKKGDDGREAQDWANKGLNGVLLTEQDVWG